MKKPVLRPFYLALSLVAFILNGSFSYGAQNPEIYETVYQKLLKIKDCGDDPCALKLKVKTDDGEVWRTPIKKALALIQKNNGMIEKRAKEYQVNPIAIAAVIVSEMSVNIQWDDRLQNTVAWSLGSIGEWVTMNLGDLFFDRAISLGVAQVNQFGLAQALETIQQVEKDESLTLFSLQKNLITYGRNLDTTIRVIAALLKNAQDEYLKYGFDIHESIGVSVTLYNLGLPAERAKKTFEENRKPAVNFLGLFAAKYKLEISEAVTTDAQQTLN